MKLKDRLQKEKTISEISAKTTSTNSGKFTLGDIFADSEETRKFITELAINKRNIILVSSRSFDKVIAADYFKSQLSNTNARIINDVNNKMDDLNGRINIVPNPDIHIIVNIFEQIIYGCQSFIFGLSLGSYDNIIKKLKVLIALHYKNLIPADITTLIGASNAVIAYISKNEDGLFFISQIDEIIANNTETDIKLKTLLINNIENNNLTINDASLTKEKETSSPPVKPDLPDEQIPLTYMIEEAEYINSEKEKKLNKYQRLKERAKLKKAEETKDINPKV